LWLYAYIILAVVAVISIPSKKRKLDEDGLILVDSVDVDLNDADIIEID